MKFTISSKNNFESDLFLRCLWSQLRHCFDNYGWNYWGVKDKNVIDLGMLDLGLKHAVNISYDYKLKGTINNIYFHFEDDDLTDRTVAKINECVSKAKDNKTLVKNGIFSIPVETYFEMQNYNGSNFQINKTEFGASLHFKLTYFDDVDKQQEAAIKTTELRKYLSLVFKLPIFSGTKESEKIKSSDCDFSRELKIIDAFIGKYDLTSSIYIKIIESVSLYQSALKIIYNNRNIYVARFLEMKGNEIPFYIPSIHQELIDIHQKIQIDIELAVVSLMSAVEIAASIESYESKACTSCNQEIYKISKRVREFSNKYGSEAIEKNIKGAYSIRSQIVHAGILLERKEIYQGVTNPRFDLTQKGSLLKMSHSLPEILLEDVRNILLKFLETDLVLTH